MIDWEVKASELAAARAWLDEQAESKDDWQILVNGTEAYLTILRASDAGGIRLQHMMKLSELKSLLVEVRSGLIGEVAVMIPTDASQRGGTDLLVWLTSVRWNKFKVLSDPRQMSTAHLVLAIS